MIITRTPHRLSFFGGGSDLVDYYTKNNGGCVLSSAINKYIYIIVNKRFDDKIRIGYSKTEIVSSVDEIEHDIVKECLKYFGVEKGIEIVSVSDIPKECGLSSSSAFTVGLIHALSRFTGITMNRGEIAKLSSDMELKLKKTRGRQDAFGCAFGGIKFIKFTEEDDVIVEPLWLKTDVFFELERRLRLFQVGGERDAMRLLNKINVGKPKTIEQLNSIKKQAEASVEIFKYNQKEFLSMFGEWLEWNWKLKKDRDCAEGITNELVEKTYDSLKERGMVGGKLSGAGESGFILSYFKEPVQIDEFKELEFKFDTKGTVVLFDSERSVI